MAPLTAEYLRLLQELKTMGNPDHDSEMPAPSTQHQAILQICLELTRLSVEEDNKISRMEEEIRRMHSDYMRPEVRHMDWLEQIDQARIEGMKQITDHTKWAKNHLTKVTIESQEEIVGKADTLMVEARNLQRQIRQADDLLHRMRENQALRKMNQARLEFLFQRVESGVSVIFSLADTFRRLATTTPSPLRRRSF